MKKGGEEKSSPFPIKVTNIMSNIDNEKKQQNKIITIWNNGVFKDVRIGIMLALVFVFLVYIFINSIPFGIVVTIVLLYWSYKLFCLGYKKGCVNIINKLKDEAYMFTFTRRDDKDDING